MFFYTSLQRVMKDLLNLWKGKRCGQRESLQNYEISKSKLLLTSHATGLISEVIAVTLLLTRCYSTSLFALFVSHNKFYSYRWLHAL